MQSYLLLSSMQHFCKFMGVAPSCAHLALLMGFHFSLVSYIVTVFVLYVLYFVVLGWCLIDFIFVSGPVVWPVG